MMNQNKIDKSVNDLIKKGIINEEFIDAAKVMFICNKQGIEKAREYRNDLVENAITNGLVENSKIIVKESTDVGFIVALLAIKGYIRIENVDDVNKCSK